MCKLVFIDFLIIAYSTLLSNSLEGKQVLGTTGVMGGKNMHFFVNYLYNNGQPTYVSLNGADCHDLSEANYYDLTLP